MTTTINKTNASSYLNVVRQSVATVIGSNGQIQTVAPNTLRMTYDPVAGNLLGILVESFSTNLLLNSQTLSTQSVTTAATTYTLSFYGTGSVTLSGTGSAIITGLGAYPTRTTYTFVATAGTLTATVSGSVTNAQLEAQSFASSWIPTTTTAVIRNSDNISVDPYFVNKFLNKATGTFYVAFQNTGIAQNSYVFTIHDGTNTVNVHTLYVNTGFAAYATASNSVAKSLVKQVAYQGLCQAAIAYNTNDLSFTVNGYSPVFTNAAFTPPTAVSMMQLGSDASASNNLNGYIQNFQFYGTRLPDTQLTSMTLPLNDTQTTTSYTYSVDFINSNTVVSG